MSARYERKPTPKLETDTEVDPIAVARLQDSSFARRRGSTPAQRAGLDPNYIPGYGTPAANNRSAGLTPQDEWDSQFSPKMGGETGYTPPHRYSNFRNVFRGNDQSEGFGQTALNRGNPVPMPEPKGPPPVPMPTITEEQANADMTASATPATAETMSPSGTGAPATAQPQTNRYRPRGWVSTGQPELNSIERTYGTPAQQKTRLARTLPTTLPSPRTATPFKPILTASR